jgi:type VI secretion system protein ImpI
VIGIAMALHLRIENVPNLPDGGPIDIAITGKRGIDIGRDSHLDWTLPDPTRYISGKHAEIRYKEGGYWLHDVSTNGTFLNAETHRMQAPRRLRTGDRFTIGHYIIAAAVEGEAEMAASPPAASAAAPPPSQQDLWALPGEAPAPPPIDPKHLRAARNSSPARPDFLDWAADVPDAFEGAAPPSPASARNADAHPSREMDWARGASAPAPEPPPPPPMPAPRRPSSPAGEAAPAWEPPPPNQPATVGGEPADPWRGRPAPLPDQRAASAAAAAPAPEEKSMAAAPPRPPLASPSITGRDVDDFIRVLARAAGVSEKVFAEKDAQVLAEQLGQVLRIVVDNLSQLLNARGQAKRMIRTSSHTVIQATENNPLKFSPSAEEALRVMFGPPTRSYLDAQQALLRGFEDIKTHQIKTYAAMQHALAALLAELDPQRIDQETEADRGVAAVLTSRKAKLWDAYVARWQAKQGADKGGLLDAFMAVFAQYYDERRS